MTDTPRTDKLTEHRDGGSSDVSYPMAILLCKKLERELAAANARIAELEKTIRALAE